MNEIPTMMKREVEVMSTKCKSANVAGLDQIENKFLNKFNKKLIEILTILFN